MDDQDKYCTDNAFPTIILGQDIPRREVGASTRLPFHKCIDQVLYLGTDHACYQHLNENHPADLDHCRDSMCLDFPLVKHFPVLVTEEFFCSLSWAHHEQPQHTFSITDIINLYSFPYSELDRK